MFNTKSIGKAVGVALAMIMTISMLSIGGAAADYDEWHNVDSEEIDIVGPTDIEVELEAVDNSDLDDEPLEVAVAIEGDNETISNETVMLESTEVDTVTFEDVDLDAESVEVYVPAEEDADDLESSEITVDEWRAGDLEIANETVEIDNSTETAFADVAIANDTDGEDIDVTLDILDSDEESVAFTTDNLSEDSLGTLEIDLEERDIDNGNVTLEVLVDEGDEDLVEVDDLGVMTSSVGGFAVTDDMEIPWTVVLVSGIVILLVAGLVIERRSD